MNRTANAAQAQRWNGESGRYWIAHRERLLAAHRRLIPHLLSAAGISPGERILDVGCGCGGTTIRAGRAAGGGEFAGFAPGGFAVGLDLSGLMLEVARGIAGRAGVTNVRFVQGDAQTCPLRRDSCDVLISSFGVMFFEDPALAFARLAAALSAGGRLAFLCWQQGPQNEIFAIPLDVFGAYTQLPGPAAATCSATRERSRTCCPAVAGPMSRSTLSMSPPGLDQTSLTS